MTDKLPKQYQDAIECQDKLNVVVLESYIVYTRSDIMNKP